MQKVNNSLIEKFSLGRKWFWVGVLMTLFHFMTGIVFGIAMITEKKKKEGWILIAFSVAWLFFIIFVISPWLIKTGLSNKLFPFLRPVAPAVKLAPGQLNPPPTQLFK